MFLNYEDFDACLVDMRDKGHDLESAQKICGALQAKFEGKSEVTTEVKAIVQEFAQVEEEPEFEVLILDGETGRVEQSFSNQWLMSIMSQESTVEKEPRHLVKKAYEGSTTSIDDIAGAGPYTGISGESEEVTPPYDPVMLRTFLEVDALHCRAVDTKTADSVGRSLKYESSVQVVPDDSDENPNGSIKQSVFDEELKQIDDFVKECNDVIGLEGVLEKAATDYEAIGYCAIEVVRSLDRVVRRVNHIPAERIKVLKGWKGFTEQVDGTGRKVYYQNFGDKVVSSDRKDLITGLPAKYNPDLDGPVEGSGSDFSLIDRYTGLPTDNFSVSANEILYKFNFHPKSIYYGVPDFVPAAGHMLANAEIRDYLLQFFEHNTVPRYAVIVKGAKVSPEVKDHIQKFFSSEVKGNAHKTLFIPLPSVRGEVEVIFERLDADQKDASFLEAKKSNDQVIMVAHGTPPAILGIAEAANLGSGKGLSQAEIYKDRIVTPRQRSWAKLLGKLYRFGLGVRHVQPAFDPLDVRDRVAEMEVLTGYQKSGNMDVNEVREAAELGKPLAGGSRPFIMPTGNVYFIDELESATSAEVSAKTQEKVAGTNKGTGGVESSGKANLVGQNGREVEQDKGTRRKAGTRNSKTSQKRAKRS